MDKRGVGLVVVALVLSGGGWVLLRPKQKLEILGPTRIPLTLETVEDIQRKPSIDIKLPIIGHVVYPALSQGQFSVDANGPGFRPWFRLDPKTTAGAIYPKGKRLMSLGSVIDLESAVWELRGQSVEIAHMMAGANFVECPLLYGSQSEEAEVSTSMFNMTARGIDRFRVRLPASGIPEPKYRSYTAKAGPWTVRFNPLLRLSPMFPLRYEVRVEGGADSIYLIRFTNAAEHVPATAYEPMLRCMPANPGIFRPAGDIFEQSKNQGKPRRLDLVIKRLAAKNLTLTARILSPSNIKLFDAAGRASVWTDSRFGPWASTLRGSDGVAALRFGPCWSPWDSSQELGRPWATSMFTDNSTAYLRTLKNGEKVEATAYSVAEVHTAQVTIDNPN